MKTQAQKAEDFRALRRGERLGPRDNVREIM